MDEQNRGGQPPQQGGWSPVGQGTQSPGQGQPFPPTQPGSYAPPPAYGAPAPPYASGSGQYPPPAPPPPPGSYGTGPGGYPPAQPPYGQPPYNQPPAPAGQGLPPTTAAALSYLTIIPAIIFLVMDPYKRSSLVRFHAWQCISLTGVWILVDIVEMVLFFIPLGPLWILRSLLHVVFLLIFLGLFVFWLIAIIKASKGERYHIPGVGAIAENFAGRV